MPKLKMKQKLLTSHMGLLMLFRKLARALFSRCQACFAQKGQHTQLLAAVISYETTFIKKMNCAKKLIGYELDIFSLSLQSTHTMLIKCATLLELLG